MSDFKSNSRFLLAGLVAAGLAAAQAPPAPPAPPHFLIAMPAPPEPPEPPMPPEIEVLTGMSGSFLGIHVAEVNEARAKELALKDEHGVEVTLVEEGSPAEKAGLKKGDVVQTYQGQRVEGTQQFIRMVRETPAGRAVKMAIHRNGSAFALTATIGTRKGRVIAKNGVVELRDLPSLRAWVPDVPRMTTAWRSPMLGVDAESVEGQLAEYFGVKEGVLVRAVTKGSAAEKAGFKAGDVVTKFDQTKVNSARELSAQVRSSRERKDVPVTVVREKREMTLKVTLEDEAGGDRGRARSVRSEGRF